MQTIIFLLKSALTPGVYLAGAGGAWTDARVLDEASLIAAPPRSGRVVITLEVDGALTEHSFVLLPSALPELRQRLHPGLTLSAGQVARWKVTECTAPFEDSAHHLAVTLSVLRSADVVVTSPEMTVWWRDGVERLRLFTYDPAPQSFTAVNAALASGRAVFATSPFSISIRGSPVLRVQSSTLYTTVLVAGGLAAADTPQLQFYVGPQPVATLTAAGALFVPHLTQASPVASAGQFVLGSGVALGTGGLVAANLEQPL